MKRILLTAMVLLSMAPLAEAVETEQEKKLGVTYEQQYHSKWLSKGAEAYGQQGAFFEIIDLDLYGSGFGLQVIHRHATGSGYVKKQRFDYRPYVRGKLFKEKPYAMKYDIGVEYEHYPRFATHKSYTSYEWQFGFSWPNILPKGFVPTYIAHYEYPVHHDFRYNYTGWVHRFKLDYNLEVSQLPKPLCLSSEVAYTDRLGGASSDWSYATFGLGTKFDITKNLTFAPGVYQQITMDKSVAKRKDITYCILSMKYKF